MSYNLQTTGDKNWSKIGLGTGTLASMGRSASIKEVNGLISAMVDNAIKVIDTADSYGSGDCEQLLGRAIKNKRSHFTLVTKAGYRLSNLPPPLRALNQIIKKGLHHLYGRQSFSISYLSKCVDASLTRLRTDMLDAFLLHSPPVEVVMDPNIHTLIGRLISSGKVAMAGISSENPEAIRAAIASGAYGLVQTPASLRAANSMKPLWMECEYAGIRLIGNHVFDPAYLAVEGMTHETLMRGSSAMLPERATILCGTRNPAHLVQAAMWANMPMEAAAAEALARQFIA